MKALEKPVFVLCYFWISIFFLLGCLICIWKAVRESKQARKEEKNNINHSQMSQNHSHVDHSSAWCWVLFYSRSCNSSVTLFKLKLCVYTKVALKRMMHDLRKLKASRFYGRRVQPCIDSLNQWKFQTKMDFLIWQENVFSHKISVIIKIIQVLLLLCFNIALIM